MNADLPSAETLLDVYLCGGCGGVAAANTGELRCKKGMLTCDDNLKKEGVSVVSCSHSYVNSSSQKLAVKPEGPETQKPFHFYGTRGTYRKLFLHYSTKYVVQLVAHFLGINIQYSWPCGSRIVLPSSMVWRMCPKAVIQSRYPTDQCWPCRGTLYSRYRARVLMKHGR